MAGAETVDEKDTSEDGILTEAKEAFTRAEEYEDDNRKAALEDMRFGRLSEQWPERIKRQRELEGRPCLTINRMPAFIRQVVNDARLNKPAISIHPVDDNADPDTAKVIQGLIRNIEVVSNAEAAYDTGLDNAVSGGFGYWRVDVDYTTEDSFDLDLSIERISNPFTVYGDPRSTAVDSSDWNVAFITELLSHEEFKKLYPGAEISNWEGTLADDKDQEWFTDDTVRIAEYWLREEVAKTLLRLSDGQTMYEEVYLKHKEVFDASDIIVEGDRPTIGHKVIQRLMTGAEILETTEWKGRYIPIIPVYGEEVNLEGRRYFRSLIRDARDSQQMYNYWRTAATELVALAPKAPWIGEEGTFDPDQEKWQTANTKSYSTLEYKKGGNPPIRTPFAGIPTGALQEGLSASDDMKSVMGIYDASLGIRSNETSGVAIKARQREGDVGTFHFIDNLSRAIRHTGLVLVDLIPHIYTEARVARILGEDDSTEPVQINQPFPVMDENGQPEVGENGEEVTRIHDLTTGKYDVTVKAGPSFSTKREESATQMMELLKAFPQAAPLIGDLLVKNLDWQGADEIAERLKALLPDNVRGDDPRIQQGVQIIQSLQTELRALQEDKSLESRKVNVDEREATVKAFEANTERLKNNEQIKEDYLNETLNAVAPIGVARR